MSQSSPRVLVIGAGLGGLCLAQGLRKAGVEVAVYERDAGLAVRTQGHRVPIEHWQSSTITLLGDAIHVMPANGSGANSALRDASQLAHSLIAVASQGTPLQQALHDYEIEMLRAGFGAVRTSLLSMQRREPGILFEQGERYYDQ